MDNIKKEMSNKLVTMYKDLKTKNFYKKEKKTVKLTGNVTGYSKNVLKAAAKLTQL